MEPQARTSPTSVPAWRGRRVDPVQAAIPSESPAPASARAVIETRIRDAIHSGKLLPGTRIKQQVLAHRFNVSRMPVREALRQLEAQGYLVGEAHKGYVVAPEGATGGLAHRLTPLRELYAQLPNADERTAFESEVLRLIRAGVEGDVASLGEKVA